VLDAGEICCTAIHCRRVDRRFGIHAVRAIWHATV
jgi:hypothetical protein